MAEENILTMLTTPDVKQMLGVSQMTLFRWRKAGKIKGVKYKGVFHYFRADIDRILKEGME
jgi:predicted site-specific integrase-resolvase